MSTQSTKRPAASVEDLSDDEQQTVKHIRLEQPVSFEPAPTFDASRDEDFDAEDFNNIPDFTGEVADIDEILKLVDEAPQIEDMGESDLRIAIVHLQKSIKTNLEMREKYPSDPSKFLDSEVDLDEAVKALAGCATNPLLFPIFISTGVISNFCDLLSHENVDIGIECINLINELVDSDNLVPSEHVTLQEALSSWKFITRLVQENLMYWIVTFLERLDETQEKTQVECVYNALSIINAIVEGANDADTANLAVSGGVDFTSSTKRDILLQFVKPETKLLKYLLDRITFMEDKNDLVKQSELEAAHGTFIPNVRDVKDGVFSTNRLFASELLSLIIQSTGSPAKDEIFHLSGIKRVISAVAPYRRFKAELAEESEFVANCFLALNELVKDSPENAEDLLNNDNIFLEVLFTFIRQKSEYFPSALKIVEACLDSNQAFCKEFINCGGLKIVFGLLKIDWTQDKKFSSQEETITDRILSSITHLMTNLSDIYYLRVLNKFAEGKGEKANQIIRILSRYQHNLTLAEKELRQISDDPHELYLLRFDHGLYTLQRCAFILSLLLTANESEIEKNVLQHLTASSLSKQSIKSILKEQCSMLELVGTQNEKQIHEKSVLESLIKLLE